MNEILGIIDSLEATILESKKVPMTTKVIIDETYLLTIIDKIRMSLKSTSSVARATVDVQQQPIDKESIGLSSEETNQQVSQRIIQEAEKHANDIKKGAHEYADDVLANLQLVIAKMQKNIVTLEKNVDSGRQVLASKKGVKEYESR